MYPVLFRLAPKSGATVFEYGLIASLIALVIVQTATAVGIV
jgi:Flp pilus assembly pilin Flp